MIKKNKKLNKLKKIAFFILTLALFGLLNISSGYAGTTEMFKQLDGAGTKAWGQAPGPSGMTSIIQTVISAFLGLLGVIFLVLIIYAGYNWMTAQGDEEKVTVAKNTLTRAVIGLIIIVAAYSITYFVFSNLPGGPGGGGGLTGSPPPPQ
ncbi:MAG: hypothetical protein V1801_02610 [Candidatus Falkowbacteria bacterium]